ncbi:hypothetical protein VTK73DRAFT_4048 [Phialemonium thermophilum]|uniref:FAD-containing monooxygenase EthA n=1 Tax=Phialemonium thermophilum TaxID=223376 RepID=A0ABR3WWE1_9PEZI
MDSLAATSTESVGKGTAQPQRAESVDVVIIGAGVSGIQAARSIQTGAPKGTTYVILDRRDRIGGTWDLFRYPGVRSDSDVFTFGFSWNPWPRGGPLATGPEIARYLAASATQIGADRHMRFRHRVVSLDWTSDDKRWNVAAARAESHEPVLFRARFVVLGTGYYDAQEPLQSPVPGLDRFQGDVLRPQFWPEDYRYVNKHIVVIGSGATAVTLLPSLAEDARHVTMVQRSPTYIASLPTTPAPWTRLWQFFLPRAVARRWDRLLRIVLTYVLWHVSRRHPQKVRRLLERASAAQLPSRIPVRPHFAPRYNPWDQRLCVCPDGDFYRALRSTKASVVTDVIDQVTEREIVLGSGRRLRPDVIVPATGLKLQFAGGIRLSVDGAPVDPATRFSWRGCMLQDVPNLVFVLGYVNASWTLGAEATGVLMARILSHMQKCGADVAVPSREGSDEGEGMERVPLFDLTSTYLRGVDKIFPKGGVGQWAPKKNYFVDLWQATWGSFSPGLKFY